MKQIPGYPDYSITKDGCVWSKRRERAKGGQLKLRVNTHGYFYVDLYFNKRPHRCSVHCLVLETYVSPCPDGMECRHLDGTRTNNKLDNLKWGTRTENMQDAVRHGTVAKPSLGKYGEKHSSSKLSNQERRLIIYQYATGLFTQQELANIYRVGRTVVSDLITGRGWPFVDTRKLKGGIIWNTTAKIARTAMVTTPVR